MGDKASGDFTSMYRLSIEQIAPRCDKVKWKGQDSFIACCVAHDDNNPSMTVTEASDGKLLVHCFAGCAQSAVLDALRIAKGKSDYPPAPQITRPRKVEKPNNYYRRLWSGTYDPEQQHKKPFTGNPDHLVSNHPYAVLKGVEHACGARRGNASGRLIGNNQDCIIVPSYGLGGNLVGVECISQPDENGKTPKQSFGTKGILVLGNDLDPEIPILMVEGWASGVSWVWHMNQGNACAIVFFGKSSGVRKQKEVQLHYPKHVVFLGVEQDD